MRSSVLIRRQTNPVIVRVSTEEMKEEFVVTPESFDCSCTSQPNVEPFCDHIVALLDAEDYAGGLMREYLKEKKNVLEGQLSDSDGSDPVAREEVDEIMSLLKAVDVDDFSLARTRVDVVSLLKSSNDDGDKIEKAPTPDNREAFEEMVKKVRVGDDEGFDLPSSE